ncbi:MAG: sodium-dependent bicarbonate transport family permease, partial [Burkholderiaceae bacterium]
LIGLLTGDAGKQIMEPFTGQLFKGMLAFFLLDMGIATASRMADLGNVPKRLLLYGVLAPPCHALIAIGLCAVFNIPAGNAALLAVLAASASYIAVPAVLKHAIPEASPVLYLGMSLGVTFPLNIIVGIPLYVGMARWLLG